MLPGKPARVVTAFMCNKGGAAATDYESYSFHHFEVSVAPFVLFSVLVVCNIPILLIQIISVF